ncbi:MAG: DUF4388 domain-containing protein [Thermodesulfobacteriota bacterium]
MSGFLEGRIKGLSLPAFLQMSEMEETSCTLQVTSGRNETGCLYLLKGRLIAAETAGLKNLAAACEIIRWEEPVIEIRKEMSKTVDEINTPLMNILMDSLRIKDEQQAEQDGSRLASPRDIPASSLSRKEPPSLESEMELELDLDPGDLELDLDEDSVEDGKLSNTAPPPAAAHPSSPMKQPATDQVIEERIRAFQDKIAVLCPLCRSGRIIQQHAGGQLPYYACSNRECNFISREKPYILACPLCANPFLIEFTDGQGRAAPGLKCPRPDCSFRQDTLLPPPPNQQGGGQTGDKQTKTYRVIRKKPPG